MIAGRPSGHQLRGRGGGGLRRGDVAVLVALHLLLLLAIALALVLVAEGVPGHLVDPHHRLRGVLQQEVLAVVPAHDEVDDAAEDPEHVVAGEAELLGEPVREVCLDAEDRVVPRVARRHPRNVADLHDVAAGEEGLRRPPPELEGVVLQLRREAGRALRLQVRPPRLVDLRVELVQRLHRAQRAARAVDLAVHLGAGDDAHRVLLVVGLGLGVARERELPVAVGSRRDGVVVLVLAERVLPLHLLGRGVIVEHHLRKILVDARRFLPELDRRVV
mmetsp:Transcript_123133/g.348930  ORF Transcript_123133/g.348930 Transcript_123133/m.348930 type:complete len:275 (+) Transcript_123133:346-1170(+)